MTERWKYGKTSKRINDILFEASYIFEKLTELYKEAIALGYDNTFRDFQKDLRQRIVFKKLNLKKKREMKKELKGSISEHEAELVCRRLAKVIKTKKTGFLSTIRRKLSSF